MKNVISAGLLALGIAVSGSASTSESGSKRSSEELRERPSVAATQSLEFMGTRYVLKFQEADQAIPTYEFFPPSESPPEWTELTAFRIYPSETGTPIEHAGRTAAQFKKNFPNMQFAMHEDERTGSVLVDFLAPHSKENRALEFNAFRFSPGVNGQVIGFQYAKRINPDREHSVVVEEIRALRKQMVQAMADFPLYRQ